MHTRNRITLFLAMPIAVFFWIFGWSLYWIGTQRDTAKLSKQKPTNKWLTFGVLIPEQKHAKLAN